MDDTLLIETDHGVTGKMFYFAVHILVNLKKYMAVLGGDFYRLIDYLYERADLNQIE